jgi:hypothetical protein
MKNRLPCHPATLDTLANFAGAPTRAADPRLRAMLQ